MQNAKPLDASELPDREPKRPGLTKDAALVSDLLKLLLKIRAKETGVAARLIARSDELEALAAGVRNNLNILRGWRFEQFGKDAVDLSRVVLPSELKAANSDEPVAKPEVIDA